MLLQTFPKMVGCLIALGVGPLGRPVLVQRACFLSCVRVWCKAKAAAARVIVQLGKFCSVLCTKHDCSRPGARCGLSTLTVPAFSGGFSARSLSSAAAASRPAWVAPVRGHWHYRPIRRLQPTQSEKACHQSGDRAGGASACTPAECQGRLRAPIWRGRHLARSYGPPAES